MALFVDTAGVDQDALEEALLAVHATYGRPALSRAYGDWTRPGLRDQLDILTDHAVQLVHAFASGVSQTSVTLTVDALDAVGIYGVSSVVLVAELEGLLPLVMRLRASGTRVVAVGPTTTPPSLRNQADEFIAIHALHHLGAHSVAGRHRGDGRGP